jgi:isoleucyl-tRNA synthetase
MEEKNAKKSESALREEKILKFWKEREIFEKSLEKTSPEGEFTFYEGPPTANGKPGIHHLEARAFKDVIPRYKTMRGYHVRRKGGWDTHGLPVELQVEKELGLKSKKEIEEYGVANFNKKCKESVWKYVDLWEKFTERIGFWLDQKNPYVTYHNDYMESVWNVIKETDKQGLLYKDYKVVPWCPRCGTALSSHELAQGYENVKDLSVYVKFKMKGQEDTYILAWTTTPWTLPGNVALAVGKKVEYVKIKKENEILILAKARLSVIEGEYEILEELKGKDLIGLEYEPLYPYLQNSIFEREKGKMEKAFKVYSADFVTTEDGTGVVHTAVMYGQDDFVLGTEIGLPKHHLVGLDGKFLAGTDFLTGRFVRDEEVAVDIIKDLAKRGLLLKKEKYEHSYPHCWRCKTALIYYARDSWYIKMSALRDKLVKENEDINWEPAHIKEGRFGEWLREIKDWAISRERYWGTPLPVWTCEKCKKTEVIGSVADLKAKTKKSGNKYFVMRHGGSKGNLTDLISSKPENIDHLTEEGRKQVLESIQKLKKQKIDLVISSDFLRTKETALIAQKELKISDENLLFDKRIREINAGNYEGKKWSEYPNFFKKGENKAESLFDVKKRVSEFLYDIEKKYQNKKILIVSHESVVRISFATDYLDFNFENLSDYRKKFPVFKNAELRELDFVPIPHDEDYGLDLHKPFIDEVELACVHCGGNLLRTKEVMDVWLDSGTMPFSQDHYPFENKNLAYPADFISEAIDQTRGWFYTLHAVGVLMGRGRAYKNVICLGLLLDATGKKMSKSVGNIVDPWDMMNKYGVDTLRLWMYSINQPGESKNFDEKTVLELHRQVFGLLYNVLAFYELYRDKEIENKKDKVRSKNILDVWILARFNELNSLCVNSLDNYRMLEPTRAIKDFIGDLSTWYLRRSRDRIKDGDKEAKQTLYFVLKNLAKIMAPFTPFASEDIWQKLKNEDDAESVHLISWPNEIESEKLKVESIIKKMEEVRRIVSLGLEARQKAGIKVRQPLSALRIKEYVLEKEYTQIIKDELNIKLVQTDPNFGEGIMLNTEITEELKEEGNYRELVRAIQDIRKKEGLTPSDIIILTLETNREGEKLIQKFETEIKKTVLASEIKLEKNAGKESKINDLVFKIKIEN